jgi:hypothetical protein
MRLRSSLYEGVPDRLAKVEAHDVHDADSMGISTQDLDLQSRTDLSFLDNQEVKAASLTRQEPLDHVVTVKL